MTSDSPDPKEVNPYADELSGPEPDTRSNAQDQSVFAEPWMQKTHFDGDGYSDAQAPVPNTNDVEHTVWDEPGLSPQLAGAVPENALTWSDWYQQQRAATSVLDTWLVTMLVTVLAAPLAIITSWFSFGGSTFDVLVLVVIIPATEELLKVALPLWVVEKRPHLFCAPFQILLCAACSGLLFGAMRHVFAVKLFMPGSLPVVDRLSGELPMSILMHTVCSLIAGMAMVRIWSGASRCQQRPDLTEGSGFGSVAIGIHIAYAAVMMAVRIT